MLPTNCYSFRAGIAPYLRRSLFVMSRADGLAAEAAEAALAEEAQHATPSKDAQKAMAYLPSFVRRVSAHQFLLAELPPDLRDALADYDVDGDGAQPYSKQHRPATTTSNQAVPGVLLQLADRSTPCPQAL